MSSPTRPLDRKGSRFRHISSSKGRPEYGSREHSEDRRERSLSPRRRGSYGYSDHRYYRQRSLSPRRHNSRWNSDERWNRERNQRCYSRYPNNSRYPYNSRGDRDGRTQNQQIAGVGNKVQSHNVAPQDQLPVPPVVYPQTQINQDPLPSNEQYGGVQNTQLYNQMWQYYYQQQQILLQQHQMPPQQQVEQQVQNPAQQQNVPTHQENPGQVVPNQQQLLQLHYQQQKLYQQSQLQLPQTNEQHLCETLQIQQQIQAPQQQSQLQEQQSYQYQQQQYFLYLQQLHQYQQSQQQPGLEQDQKSLDKQVELPEKRQDQQMLTGLQHKNKDLPSQDDFGPSEVNSIKGSNDKIQGIDNHASTSGATGPLKSQDELPEIE